MQLKKMFLTTELANGTVSGGLDDPTWPVPVSVLYPNVPIGTCGTGRVDNQRAIMIRNDGQRAATFWFQQPGLDPYIPPTGLLLNDHSSAGTVTVAPGKTAILPNGGKYSAFTYSHGPVLVMHGIVYYSIDLNPNDPSEVVWA